MARVEEPVRKKKKVIPIKEVKKFGVFKAEGYLVNLKNLTDEQILDAKERFQYMFYDDNACSKCDNEPNKHNETCDNCESFKGRRQLAKVIEKEDQLLLSLPYGATDKVRSFLKTIGRPYKVVNCHPELLPMRRKVSLLETTILRDWQVEARDKFIVEKKGVVKAPARSGKSLMAAAVAVQLGTKTLIMASQRDWLMQFQETFIGSSTAPAYTDATPRQVRFCKTYEEFMNTDICLATPQQFMNKRGKKLLERIKDTFGLFILDEVHLLPALESSRVVSRINAEYRLALSATPARKQEMLFNIILDLIGPIIYEAKVEQLKPTVSLLHTGLKFDLKNGNFTSFVNRLEYAPKRIQMIADRAIKAVEDGHTVLIPVMRTKAIMLLMKAINEAAEDRIAYPFYGGLPKPMRKQTIEDTRNGKIKVLVGNTKLLSTGLNIPIASCLISSTLSNNLQNCEQRTARILTPIPGKKTPELIYVLDDCAIMQRTLRNEWWNCIYKKYNPRMDAETRKQFMAWMGGKAGSETERLEI